MSVGVESPIEIVSVGVRQIPVAVLEGVGEHVIVAARRTRIANIAVRAIRQ